MNPDQVVDALAFWSLIASIFSIGISCIAIMLALVFYRQGTQVETKVAIALAEIKAQTDTLQRISGSQIRQLTKAVTSQSPTEQALLSLIQVQSTANLAATIQSPSTETNSNTLRGDVIAGYIGLYYYSALLNRFLIALAPSYPGGEEGKLIDTYIDSTYKDFQIFKQELDSLENIEIQQNRMAFLFNSTESSLESLVKTSVQARETEGEGGE